jgi:RNA ligase (TIGR02306 family)
MSDFGIYVEVIEKVWPHPNADKLELAKLKNVDYQFVVPKDSYKAEDPVLYIPEDAICPEKLLEQIGLKGKLGGANKNRVKAIKLRGEVSQGVVAKLEVLKEYGFTEVSTHNQITKERVNFANDLGIEKYDADVHTPGIPNASSVIKNPLPGAVSVYDLENAERLKWLVELLLDEEVIITEKLEGSHTGLFADREVEAKPLTYCSRRTTLTEENTFWHRGAANSGLEATFARMIEDVKQVNSDPNLVALVRGELIGPGVQGNIYGLKDLEVRIFDVEINRKPVDSGLLFGHWVTKGIVSPEKLAPIIFRGKLRDYIGSSNLRELSNGKSLLADTLREGIVIKPMIERWHPKCGRVVIKQRSPEYLAGSKL